MPSFMGRAPDGPAPTERTRSINVAFHKAVELVLGGAERIYIGLDLFMQLTSNPWCSTLHIPRLATGRPAILFGGVPLVLVAHRNYIAATPPCARCGDVLPVNAKFCVACGVQVAPVEELARPGAPVTGKTMRLEEDA